MTCCCTGSRRTVAVGCEGDIMTTIIICCALGAGMMIGGIIGVIIGIRLGAQTVMRDRKETGLCARDVLVDQAKQHGRQHERRYME